HLSGAAGELVAHADGEGGAEGRVLQGIFHALDGHAPAPAGEGKGGKSALEPGGKGQPAPADGGEGGVPGVQGAPGAPLGQKVQALDVGQRVVYTPAGAAVQGEA